MNNNLTIPGWNSSSLLDIIKMYSRNIPENGNILELGALFGRTTVAIGESKPKTATMYTIDIWPKLPIGHIDQILSHDSSSDNVNGKIIMRLVDPSTQMLSGDDFHLLWSVFTSHIENLKGIKSHTNISTSGFPDFDLIIHDAAHDYEHVYEDLTNWFPKLKSGGIMIIDDYDKYNWPGVVKAVDQYALENNIHVELLSTRRNVILRK